MKKPEKAGLADVPAWYEVRTTDSIIFICVSSHSSPCKCKKEELPAPGLLKHCDLMPASSQIQAILLHHFASVEDLGVKFWPD